jgi:ABC-type transport system involved in multi-copper enzyme maturation permease subunit
MLMGPVFRAELLRTGRRGRYYVLRLVYGMILLTLSWSGYQAKFAGSRTASIAAVAQFAETTFLTFAIVQLVTVLVIVPPLFGGTIADEKQRKTLHYLMASQLSAAEIVTDKTLGRLPHLAVLMAIGLPIISILGLVGGVSAEEVAVVCIGTASTCACAAGLTVLISTLARRVRQAVLLAYTFLFGWMVGPAICVLFGSTILRREYEWIRPVNEWLAASTPTGVFMHMAVRSRTSPTFTLSAMRGDFEWMVGLQLGAAALFLLLAVWRLRPTFRRQEETPVRRGWFKVREPKKRSPRWFARPECGTDAVLWKERYFAPNDRFTRLVLVPAIALVTLPLAIFTEVEGNIGARVVDFCQHGFRGSRFGTSALAATLRLDVGWYTAFWLLAVAGAAASSVTLEREADTWVSLTSTPLTGWQILRAKVLGAIWNQRGFTAVLVFLWLTAVLTGAVRSRDVLVSILIVGVLTCLVAAMGIYFSLHASNTSRALVATILGLCVLNGYPVILFLWFRGALWWDGSFSLLGFMPRLAAAPLVSSENDAGARLLYSSPWQSYADPIAMVPGGGVWLFSAYVITALFLCWRIVTQFDRWLDRPKLSASR